MLAESSTLQIRKSKPSNGMYVIKESRAELLSTLRVKKTSKAGIPSNMDLHVSGIQNAN